MNNLVLPGSLPTIKSPDELVSAQLKRMHATWLKLAAGRFAPTRKEIAPSRFKEVLPSIFLIDVLDDGEDFRFSLGGDRLVRFLHERFDPGAKLSSTEGSNFYERCSRLFRLCVSARKGLAVGPARAALPGREFMELETLVLPLSDDGENVTGILGAVYVVPLVATDPHDVHDQKMPRAFPIKAKQSA
jgi:hypothetical protein